MNNITLNSSMRSNLLSLQNVSRLQDVTSNRLSTGLKVNSAIDNPSSFYAAQSLTNRASDLNALLDSMSQGVQSLKAASQSLKAASQSLEAGANFLQQAKAVANQAMEKTQPIIAKVTTEAELLAALSSGKQGLIVINSNITMSDNSNIILKNGQSLVGARYLDKTATQTTINFNFVGEAKNGIEAGNNSIISDLSMRMVTNEKGNYESGHTIAVISKSNVKINNISINYDNSADTKYVPGAAIFNSGTNSNTIITGKIDLKVNASEAHTHSTRGYSHGILNFDKGNITLNANANIDITGTESHGIYNMMNGTVNIIGNSNIKIKTNSIIGIGIYSYTNSYMNIKDNSIINILTTKNDSGAISNYDRSTTSFSDNVQINIETQGRNSSALQSESDGTFNISGKTIVNVLTKGYGGISIYKSTVNLRDDVKINLKTLGEQADSISNSNINIYGNSILNTQGMGLWAAGVSTGTINIHDNGTLNAYAEKHVSLGVMNLNLLSASAKVSLNSFTNDFMSVNIHSVKDSEISNKNGKYISTKDATNTIINTSNLPAVDYNRTGNTDPINYIDVAKVVSDAWNLIPNDPAIETNNIFSNILSQYNNLIDDSSYLGINLLQEQNLKINFNEDRSSTVDVKGVDASSKGLGLTDATWKTQEDIEKSISELDSAIGKIRSYSSEFGNYYNIVSTRESFTKAMVNVLEEGSDKLSLADMNQESANMLALQTRQQLAINSLSLASQAAQSVLKLF